ncbi:hypothetical protein AWH62_07390 [Maricaulis sp. W15]|nr:hypothetical protein AWH62_07390 [Maricaulis sp. W15]
METDAFAAYGQASYDLTDRLGVTVGARWTRETKDFSATGEGIPQGSEGPGNPLIEEVIDARTSRTWEDTSFRFGLDYDVSSNILLYFNLAQGFKSGGFNGQPVTNADALMGFEPEYAEQIELGWRSDLFDNRLRINGAIYQTDYQDLQISAVPDIGSPFTANAANAEVTGFELEYSWSPTPNLTLSGSTAYIDATFKDFTVFEQGALRVRDGERMRGIPEWTTSLSGQYVHAIPQGTLIFRGDYVWQDERVSNDQDIHAPAWDRTDLRVTYLSPDDRWSLSAWARNVFDEVYWLRVGPEVTAPASMRRALEPPQTFGVSLQVNL